MKTNRNANKYKRELFLLYFLQVLVLITPVLIVVILKKEEYIRDSRKAFSLGFGAITALTIIALQIAGKLPKTVHIIIKLGLTTVFLWMLRPILDELCLLTTCAFAGETAAWLIFTKPIITLKAKADYKDAQNIERSVDKTEESASGRV